MNIIVTGTGANLGQSICKILTEYNNCNRIIATDIHDRHAGKFLSDKFEILPECTESSYLQKLSKLVTEESAELIIPGSEPEIKFFNRTGTLKVEGAKILLPNSQALHVGFDKLKTAHFLKENGLNFPETAIVDKTEKVKFPGILKSREGSGSQKIRIIRTQEEYEFFRKKFPDYILQEYLGKEEDEYTCGLFRNSLGNFRQITFRRRLSGGYSSYGVVEYNDEISQLLQSVAIFLKLRGSINVQLRMTKKGPIIFEINPRFSSTVYVRHKIGFKDLIWSIEDLFDLKLSGYSPVPAGTAFYRSDSFFLEKNF